MSPPVWRNSQVMYDMKAEMGALRRALHQAGICVDAPYNKKNKEQPINGSQKPKFAGIAKRANRSKMIASKSLVPDKIPTSIADTDSEDEPHEISNMAVAVRRKVPMNPRALTRSADLHGITRSDHVRARAMAEEYARSAEEDLTMKYRNITLPLITPQPEMQWLRKWSMTSIPQGLKTMTRCSVRKAR